MSEKFAKLAKTTEGKNGRELYTGKIKIGMVAKAHALYCGFCNQRNKEISSGSFEWRVTVMGLIVHYCLKKQRYEP